YHPRPPPISTLLPYTTLFRSLTGPGAVAEPLIVGPAISVSIAPQAGIVPLSAKSFDLSVTVHSNVKGPAKGTVRLDLPGGWKAQDRKSTRLNSSHQIMSYAVF